MARGRKKGTEKTGGRQIGKPNNLTLIMREKLKVYLDKELDFINENLDNLDVNTRLALFTKILSLVLPAEKPADEPTKQNTQPIIIFTNDEKQKKLS
jgi:hypothetical protein